MPASFHSFYLSDGMRPNAFLPRGFGDAGDRQAATHAAARRRVEPSLLAELRAQNEAFAESPARRANLAALAQPGAAVVVTGQQVGLFLGPLYTLYKAASAIAIARSLGAETGVPCVPLFWLQTEDHDFAEIARCAVPRDGSPPLELELPPAPGEARVSIADRHLPADIRALLDALEDCLARLPYGAEVLSLLGEHYRPGVPPGRAFAFVLAALFADDGLVLYDPRQKAAARLLAPMMRKALVEAAPLEALLAERVRALRQVGLKEQVTLRQGAALCFVHDGGPRGPRHRPVRSGERFHLPGGASFTEPELLDLLEREPLRFSTSALLRPIAQDLLFPTAVVVGGPAEVDYFAQLAPLYPAFGLEPPLVAHRARFRLIPARTQALLQKLNLAAADLDRPRDELLRAVLACGPEVAGPLAGPDATWGQELEARLDEFGARAAAVDPSLARGAARFRALMRRSLERLARRHERLTLAREGVTAERLARAEAWLKPGGSPQERVFSFPAFAARWGPAALVRAIGEAVDPFDPTLREIVR